MFTCLCVYLVGHFIFTSLVIHKRVFLACPLQGCPSEGVLYSFPHLVQWLYSFPYLVQCLGIVFALYDASLSFFFFSSSSSSSSSSSFSSLTTEAGYLGTVPGGSSSLHSPQLATRVHQICPQTQGMCNIHLLLHILTEECSYLA